MGFRQSRAGIQEAAGGPEAKDGRMRARLCLRGLLSPARLGVGLTWQSCPYGRGQRHWAPVPHHRSPSHHIKPHASKWPSTSISYDRPKEEDRHFFLSLAALKATKCGRTLLSFYNIRPCREFLSQDSLCPTQLLHLTLRLRTLAKIAPWKCSCAGMS